MGTVSKVLEQINQYVWGLPTLLLLVSTGIILTVR
ncbi:sodium:alanine symporter family protein, partial [Bacillus cereus]